jgi:ferric-dicitrate binding protein FerR (iron transport regulator)
MDDLRRARLERRVVARARGGSSTSQELAPVAASVSAAPRPSEGWRSSRVLLGGLALAAAALIGFVVRGAMGPEPVEGPRFAIGSAFETREGTLSDGARIELASGEEGRLEIGDVSAALRDGGAMEVRSTDVDDVRLVLDRGTAELAFHPHQRGRQHLRIATPSADVEVVGTVFTVAVDARGTTVSVREGTVRVTGRTDGSSVLVHAGDAVTVPPIRTASAATAASADHASTDRSGAPVAAELVASTPSTPVITPPAAAALPAPLAFRPTRAARVQSPVATPGVGVIAQAPSEGSAVSTDSVSQQEGISALAPAPTIEAEVSLTLGDPRTTAASAAAPIEAPHALSELTAVHPRVLAVDSWSAHRPSSREIAAAWHDIDELQARGQFERSLELLVRLEHYAPESDQDEALFDRARTVQEALRRPRAARALYAEYVRRFPEGRHIQEVRRRLDALGGPEEVQPPVVIDGTILDGDAP